LADDKEMRFAPKNDTLSMPAKKKPEPRVEQSCDFRFAAPAAPASRAVVDEQAKTEAATLEPPAQTAIHFSSEKNQPEAAIPGVEGQENRRHITNEDPLLDCRIYQPIPEEVRIERGLYFPSLPQCECEKP